MALLDFLFGKKQEEQKAPPVVFGPEKPPASGAKMLFTPASAPVQTTQFSGQGSSPLSLKSAPKSSFIAPAIPKAEADKIFADARIFNEKKAKADRFVESSGTLRGLINEKHFQEGADVDEFVESAIANGRRIAASEYVSAKQASKYGNFLGSTALVADRVAQAGEGTMSAAYDLPGRIGESLGFKNNFLTRVTGQQKLSTLREFIAENAPDRLPEFEAAVAQEGYSRGSEITGRTLETVAESVAVGSAIYRATASIPAMQKLAEGGRWSRYLYTAIQNVAADVGIRSEQAYKNKQTSSDIARGVASSPSMLFAFHSIPAIGLGVGADLLAGHVNGLPLQDNFLNAAMNLGGNTLDYRGLKETRRLADVPLEDIEAHFKKTTKGPQELVDAIWQENQKVYSYAQANPEDVKGVQKMYFDGEKRLLKLKKDLEKVSIEGEKRTINLTGPEGKAEVPEDESLGNLSQKGEPDLAHMSLKDYEAMTAKEKADTAAGMDAKTALAKERADFLNGPAPKSAADIPEAKMNLGKAREHAEGLLKSYDDIGIGKTLSERTAEDFITDETGLQSTTEIGRSKQFAAGAMEVQGKGWLKKYGISTTDDLSSSDAPGIREAIRKAINDEPAGSNRAVEMRRILRSMPDDVSDEYVSDLFRQGREPKRATSQRLQELIDNGFVSGKDLVDETTTVQDVLDSLIAGESRAITRAADTRAAKKAGTAPTGVPGVPTRVQGKESILDPIISPSEQTRISQYAETLTPKAPPDADALAATTAAKEKATIQSDLQRAHREFLEGPLRDAEEVAPSKFDEIKDTSTLNTPYHERVNIADKFASRRDVLKKLGMEAEYRALRQAKTDSVLWAKNKMELIAGWEKAAPGAKNNVQIAQFLDGQIPMAALSPEARTVVQQIRPDLNEAAKAQGLRPGRGFLQDYFPRIWDKNSMKAELPEEIALRIAEQNDPASSTYNPFTQKRHGAEGYKLDAWSALEAYYKRASRTIHMDPVLRDISAKTSELSDPSQIRYIKRFIDTVNFRPTDTDVEADNFIKQHTGGFFGPRPTSTITRKIRSAISRGAFWFNPMTYFRNLTQGVNTYAELGERYTIQGYATTAKKWATRDFAEWHREGILDGGIIEARAPTPRQKALQKLDEAGFAGMRATEFINRVPAYEGAKAKALAGKVKGVPKGNERAAIEYAKDVVEKTQFRMDELGLPEILSSDIAKTALQFQPYTIKQTEFLGRKLKGALQGDTKEMIGLTRYAIGSAVLLGTVAKALGLDWKTFLPGARMLEDGGFIPPFAAPIIALAQKGLGVREDQQVDLARSLLLFVPGGTQGKKVFDTEMMRQRGGKLSQSGKSFLYASPEDDDLWQWIKAYAFGPGSTRNAHEYYRPGSTLEPGVLEKVGGMFSPKKAPPSGKRLSIPTSSGGGGGKRLSIPSVKR